MYPRDPSYSSTIVSVYEHEMKQSKITSTLWRYLMGLHRYRYTTNLGIPLWTISYPPVETFALGAKKNRLIKTVLLSTHSICFVWEIRKVNYDHALLSGGLGLSLAFLPRLRMALYKDIRHDILFQPTRERFRISITSARLMCSSEYYPFRLACVLIKSSPYCNI